MTVDALMTAAGAMLGYSASDVTRGGAVADLFLGFVNSAQRELERARDWAFLYARTTVTTAVDSQTVDLPADFASLRMDFDPYYADALGYRLRRASGEFLVQARAGGAVSSDRPTHYDLQYAPTEDLWRLDLWPTPDAALGLIVDYKRRLDDVTAGDAVPAIPTRLHDLLQTLVMCIAEEQLERAPRGSQRDKYERDLAAEFAAMQPDRGHGRLILGGGTGRRPFPDPAAGDMVVGQVTSAS